MAYVLSAETKGGDGAVKEQEPRPVQAWDPAEEARRRKLHTMVFDDEDEYVRFIDYVYDRFGGAGLGLTNVPIITSIRVKGWLLEQAQNQFAMRPVTEEDMAKVRERLKGRRPFDPKNLDDFHVPGIPRQEKER